MNSLEKAKAWPIFVISLPDAHERRHQISQQCTNLELPFEFIDAIDGRAGLPAEFESEIDREKARLRCRRPLSDAEFACALSHRLVYRHVIDAALPGALILEDDAILSPQFAEFVGGEGFREADFIQMDYWPARVFWRRRQRWSDEITLLPLAENTCLASCYSISARGAAYMLSQTAPLAGLADWPCDMVPLGPLVTVPRLAHQAPESVAKSSLSSERDDLFEQREPGGRRWTRFGRRDYWRRWWMKRRTRRLP